MAAKKKATEAPTKEAPAKKTPTSKAPGKKTTTKKAATKKRAGKAGLPKEAGEAEKVAKPKQGGKAEAFPKNSRFLERQREHLLELQSRLISSMTGKAVELREAPEGSEASGSGMHQGDAGSDAYDRDFALSMLAKNQDALFEIEQALDRMDRGVYGICEISGKKIPQVRLEALPFARLTLECQSQWEKENGNRPYRSRSGPQAGYADVEWLNEKDEEDAVDADGD